MKIVLISPYLDITCFGLRVISSVLKQEGHTTRMIFMPKSSRVNPAADFLENYSQSVLNQVIELCKDMDLIGISLMTNYFDRVVHLTHFLKKYLDISIIWGGIHATVAPHECLQYADIVCIGEGEESLIHLVEHMESGKYYQNLPGLWFAEKGKVMQNPIAPIPKDLDKFPFPDYELKDHYVLKDDTIHKMDIRLLESAMKEHMNPGGGRRLKVSCAYSTMKTRGCPLACSYCCNCTFRRMYPKENLVRTRSNKNLISELQQIKGSLKFIDGIAFCDDSFLTKNTSELAEFCKLYKEEIGLPFYCLAIPTKITEESISCLSDAGLMAIRLGLQTGSKNIKRLYKRMFSNKQIIKATKIINRYKTIHPFYDLIVDCPNETEADKIETIKLMMQIPKPYTLDILSLTLYPGTDLYLKAKREGLINSEKEEIYRKCYAIKDNTYLNFILILYVYKMSPKFLISIAINPFMIRIARTRIFSALFRKNLMLVKFLISRKRNAGRFIRKIIRRDFKGLYSSLLKNTFFSNEK